jgi:hypothetical protein
VTAACVHDAAHWPGRRQRRQRPRLFPISSCVALVLWLILYRAYCTLPCTVHSLLFIPYVNIDKLEELQHAQRRAARQLAPPAGGQTQP